MELGISADQLRVFAAAVEEGSFSAAARRLGRSQSSVTYAVQKLEAAVGTPLFDRSGYRPELTVAGCALLTRARRVIEANVAFTRQALALREGIEPELFLVVDAMFPMPPLYAALMDFDAHFPSVQTRLYVESLGATVQAVLDRKADLGIVIDVALVTDELASVSLDPIELVPVAAPTHRLALHRAPGDPPLNDDALRDHLQLVLTDRSELTRSRDSGVVALRTWRLSDLGAKHAMLLAGMGWGTMPLHMVAADLTEGRLVRLDTERWPLTKRPPTIASAIVRRHDRPLGPAAEWLLRRIVG